MHNLISNDSNFSGQNLLKTIIDNVPEIIFYKDPNGRYIGANKTCTEFYASNGVYDFLGKTDSELPLDKNFIHSCIKHDQFVLQSAKSVSFTEAFVRTNGETQIFETIKTPVFDDSGIIWGIVGVVRDITAQKSLEDHLRYLSYTDTLSGLYNRAYFNEVINTLLDQDIFPIGFILGDVNGLKIINDTLGHLIGDQLIQAAATLLKEVCPPDAYIFRWGGDEFVILLPHAGQEDCVKLMDSITLEAEKIVHANFKLSISLGSSLLNSPDANIDMVMQQAEDKLYRQKMLNAKSLRSSILTTLQNSLATNNIETHEHTQRVVDYSMQLGKALGLNTLLLDELSLVAKLHDIGKIGIPASLLLKPDKLTPDEFEIIKTHTEKGYRFTSLFPELSHISTGILTHHENWDGSGYPLGLKGEEIPVVARIVGVVDAYDAMTHNSPYHPAKNKSDALAELCRCAGSHFDPEIVSVFCNLI